MVTRHNSARLVRFGIFEADLQERELFKNGRKVKLQEQPFDVLVTLLEHPGETVSTEELARRIWPQGTYVDFEHSLSTAVLKIRRVLDDSAGNPRFVETIPRHGYRFIAPVQTVARPLPGEWKGPPLNRRLSRNLLLAATLLLIVGLIWFVSPGEQEFQAPVRIVPLTSFPGWEWMHSFSPDGNQIAFSRCEPGTWIGDGNCDVYVKHLDAHETLRLTTYPGVDGCGAWSPDGRWIAFLRSPPTGIQTYYLVPSIGGTERKLADTYPMSVRFGNTISWFPHGEKLIVARSDSPDELPSLFLVTIGSNEQKKLTNPLAGSLGDSDPAVSPDGRTIVFSRNTRSGTGGLFLLELTDELKPRGEPVRLTSNMRRCQSPVWTSDGSEIIFVSEWSLWRMRVTNGQAGQAEQLPLLGGRINCPALSPDGRRLAYSQAHGQDNIMRIELSEQGRAIGIPAKFVSSTRNEMWPEYSPDGGRFAFLSDRSGAFEIWTCDSDGSSPLRVASYSGTFGVKLNWSPEGKWIAFPSIREGKWVIEVVPSQGGDFRRLMTGLVVTGFPSELTIGWSLDGKWIHYSTEPADDSKRWKIPAAGGNPVRAIEAIGGGFSETSAKGVLYYLKAKTVEPRHLSLRRLDLRDGTDSEVLDSVYRSCCAVTDTGVYFIPRRDPECRCFHLEYLDFATGKITTISDIQDVGEGISVSSDGRSLLFTERSQTNSDIMVVENFR